MFRYISINIPRQIIIWFRSQHQPIRNYCLSFWPIIAERVFCLLLPVEYARCCLSITLLSFCDLSSQSEASMRMFWPMGGLGSLPCNPWQPLYTQLVIKFSWWIEKWEKTYGGRIKCRKIFILQDKYFLVLIFRFYCGSDPHYRGIKIQVYLMYHLWNWIFWVLQLIQLVTVQVSKIWSQNRGIINPWAGSEDYTDINDKDDKANKNYIKLESGVPCL